MHRLFDLFLSQAPAEAPETPLPETLPWFVPEQAADLWHQAQDYTWIGFLVIVAAAFILAKLSELVISRGLTRLTRKTETQFDDQLIGLIQRPIFNTVMFFGLMPATLTLGLPPAFSTPVVRVLATFIVLTWFRAGFPIVRLVLDALGRHRQRFKLIEERTIPIFDITSKLLLVGSASYLVLQIWHQDPIAWVASAGVIGIAVGFAAKDTLANLFSGFFILADAPYSLGDFVVLPSGERGQITHVGMRSTRLLTRDDIEIIMPNALMANAKIINESGGPHKAERIRIKVGVAYGSDVDQVCAELIRLAVEHPHIYEEPSPRVRMRGFGASSLDFELLCWIDDPILRGKLSHELYMEVYKSFDKLGIEIPYAKSDVYIKEMPGVPG